MVKTHILKSFPQCIQKINFIWIIDQSIKGKTKILKHTISLQYLGVLLNFKTGHTI